MEVGSTGSERALTVLLVEDNPTEVELVESMLRHNSAARFDVTVADSLAAALEWLAKHTPDVVLLDLTLPDSSGLATYRSVRHRDPEVPVVVMTGLQDVGLGQSAMQQGAQDFLSKGTANDVRLAETLIFAIERARHTAHVLRDPLTGLATPALLGERIAEALLRSEREKRYVAVLAIGLDGFAGIDVRFGPNSGEELLYAVAERLCNAFPPPAAARPGGGRTSSPPCSRDWPARPTPSGPASGCSASWRRRSSSGSGACGWRPASGSPWAGRRPTGRVSSDGPGRRWPTSAARESRASASPPEGTVCGPEGALYAHSGPENGSSYNLRWSQLIVLTGSTKMAIRLRLSASMPTREAWVMSPW